MDGKVYTPGGAAVEVPEGVVSSNEIHVSTDDSGVVVTLESECQTHIADGRAGRENFAICGYRHNRNEFYFLSLDHWYQNNLNGGRLYGCPKCLENIRLVVEDETDG